MVCKTCGQPAPPSNRTETGAGAFQDTQGVREALDLAAAAQRDRGFYAFLALCGWVIAAALFVTGYSS